MTIGEILGYCFLLGLLHGILPDEHTWPITFSYAVAGGTGREGLRAGLYFSAAFTLQRMIVSEIACLALAPFLRSVTVDAAVYVAVGVAMSVAGWMMRRRGTYAHLHVVGHHHEQAGEMDTSSALLMRRHAEKTGGKATPIKWTLIHGFIAGFGFGGLGLFVNAVAAPAMPLWIGFLPGLLFGLGTIVTVAAISAAFGVLLQSSGRFSEQEAQRIGAQIGATALFFGGFIFVAIGAAMLAGLSKHMPVDIGYVAIAIFVVAVVIPAIVHALKNPPAPTDGLAQERS